MKPTTDTTLALALALDGAAAPATDEIKRLSGIAGMVDALPDPNIDARFVARLEATLMAAYDAKFGSQASAPLHIVKPEPAAEKLRDAKTAPNVVSLPQRRFVVRRAIAGMVAAAMLSALPVVAAASSLPGSPFFGIEQWRQSHAISSAHGAEKAFTSARIAHKWIGYAAQMAVLGYNVSDIEATLYRAGELQTQAADLIARFGSTSEIAMIAGMLAADAARLREILPRASEEARPAVQDAITTATDLTRSLVAGLRAIGAEREIPLAVSAELARIDSPPASSSKVDRPTTSDPKTSPDPGTDPVEGPKKEWFTTGDDVCQSTIGEAEFGDLLEDASEVACIVRSL